MVCTAVANNSLAAVIILATVLPAQSPPWFSKTNNSAMSSSPMSVRLKGNARPSPLGRLESATSTFQCRVLTVDLPRGSAKSTVGADPGACRLRRRRERIPRVRTLAHRPGASRVGRRHPPDHVDGGEDILHEGGSNRRHQATRCWGAHRRDRPPARSSSSVKNALAAWIGVPDVELRGLTLLGIERESLERSPAFLRTLRALSSRPSRTACSSKLSP